MRKKWQFFFIEFKVIIVERTMAKENSNLVNSAVVTAVITFRQELSMDAKISGWNDEK